MKARTLSAVIPESALALIRDPRQEERVLNSHSAMGPGSAPFRLGRDDGFRR